MWIMVCQSGISSCRQMNGTQTSNRRTDWKWSLKAIQSGCNSFVYVGNSLDFLKSQIWKEIMLELNGKPPSVTMFSTNFSLKNQAFLEFIWIFSTRNLPHSESKSYQINFIESCSTRSFHQHQTHIPIPLKFWATIYFNLQWRNHSIFKNFCTSPKVMEPSPCTPPCQELSKDTKNTVWSIPVWWTS